MNLRFWIVNLSMLFFTLAWFGSTASPAQDGKDKKKEDEPSYARKFWKYLENGDYKLWAPMPGQDGELYKGTPPHGAFLKVYANRITFKNIEDPPHGSIIVKENYNKEKELAAITVMYRSKGYDPENKDWWWVKYKPNGKVFTKDDMPIAGQVGSCIDCHAKAKGNDYIFTNEKNKEKAS